MIYICTDTNRLSEEEKHFLYEFLPNERREKLLRKTKDFSAALLAYALLFSLADSHLTIAYSSFGRPFFKENPRLFFSISHTPGAAMVAFSEHEVGVDTEKADRVLSPGVLKRYFTPSEQSLLTDPACAVTLWTLKEAYGKKAGKGIAYPLFDICFTSLFPPKVNGAEAETFQKDGYVFSYCAEKKEEVLFLTANEVVSMVRKRLA